MNTINERMKRIILFKEESVSAFAARIGKSRANTSNMLNHREGYSKELLQQIMTLYNDINISWIKTGKGCPFRCEMHSNNGDYENQLSALKQVNAMIQEDNRALAERLMKDDRLGAIEGKIDRILKKLG